MSPVLLLTITSASMKHGMFDLIIKVSVFSCKTFTEFYLFKINDKKFAMPNENVLKIE